jgi:nucleotide-binding universal stress UspA family protein
VWDRLLCAIDQFESGQSALDFAAGVASSNDASVRLLHIREVPRMARALPLESPVEAEELLRDAVAALGMLGVATEGRSCSVLQEHVARRIVEEAELWECQAIILGSRRVRGIARLSGRGVRERILRMSSLPVLVAPAAETNGIYWPPRFRAEREQSPAASGRQGTADPGIRGVG